MSVSLEQITELRDQTGAGISAVKEALEEAGGDKEKALDLLRKKGASKAAKRAENTAAEGIVYAYIHTNNKVGAIIELKCETDFVARNEAFTELAHDIAMHITAQVPLYVKPEDVPEELLDKEKQMITEELKAEGKPEDMIEKITEGKIEKWYEEICLYNQKFIKNEDITVKEYIEEKIAALSEKIEVAGFSRRQI